MQIGSVIFDVGSIVSLRTQNTYDQNVYTGKVSSICDYGPAADFSDVAAYHSSVAKTVPGLGLVTDMIFFSVETDTEGRVYIAKDWVATGDITLVSAATTVEVTIYDIPLDDVSIAQLKQVLTDARYRHKVHI